LGEPDTLCEAFCEACNGGHISLAKWLYELVGPSLLVKVDASAFVKACLRADIRMAQWLHQLGYADTKMIPNDEVFEMFAIGRLRFTRWLCELAKVDELKGYGKSFLLSACVGQDIPGSEKIGSNPMGWNCNFSRAKKVGFIECEWISKHTRNL
jgi:hypothetical protein